MARYSPEMLAALRYRYEETDEPMSALAAAFEIGITTLQNLVRKHGWTPRSNRMRDCPQAMRLLQEAEILAASSAAAEQQSASPAAPMSEGASDAAAPTANASSQSGGNVPIAEAAAAHPRLSAAKRLEALVEKEIAAEEAARAALGVRPRSRNEIDRCVRTLSVLTQTLQTLRKMGGVGEIDEADEARDMDEFRETLALRIRSFVEKAIGSGRMALEDQIRPLTNDELKELIELGRAHGMPALLRPAAESEEIGQSRTASSARPRESGDPGRHTQS